MKSVDKIILHGWGEIQPRKYISLKILQLRSIEAKYRWKQVGVCTELIVIWSEKLCRIQLVKKTQFFLWEWIFSLDGYSLQGWKQSIAYSM